RHGGAGSLALRLLALGLLSGQAFICNFFTTWPDVAINRSIGQGRIDDDDVVLAGRRANKLGLAFVGLCPPIFPVGPSACLISSLKYDLPSIILVGTGRRRQNQVRQESSVRRSQ